MIRTQTQMVRVFEVIVQYVYEKLEINEWVPRIKSVDEQGHVGCFFLFIDK